MRRTALPPIVYAQLYPHPRSTDPQSFASHLTKNLIPEVRTETQTFYGTLDCIEARYPGLDYTHRPHRMRLNRFSHHRRLFRAFDELGLTKDEILSLCRWEGTRWARERYEREENVKVRDTSGDEIVNWVPSPTGEAGPSKMTLESELENNGSDAGSVRDDFDAVEARVDEDPGTDDVAQDCDGADETDGEIESVGIALNHRLNVAALMREHGENVVMDEAWEQWLKEAIERGIPVDPASSIRVGHLLPAISSLAGGSPMNRGQGGAGTNANVSAIDPTRTSTDM